jgi:hypothetical protein
MRHKTLKISISGKAVASVPPQNSFEILMFYEIQRMTKYFVLSATR